MCMCVLGRGDDGGGWQYMFLPPLRRVPGVGCCQMLLGVAMMASPCCWKGCCLAAEPAQCTHGL